MKNKIFAGFIVSMFLIFTISFVSAAIIPVCDKIGTSAEGWYQNGSLVKFDKCNLNVKNTGSYKDSICVAKCQEAYTREEGFYSSCSNKVIKLESCVIADLQQTPYKTLCTDTDGGLDRYTAGELSYNNITFKDICAQGGESYKWAGSLPAQKGDVLEYACYDDHQSQFCGDSFCHFKISKCEFGCINGACIQDVREQRDDCVPQYCADGSISKCTMNMATNKCQCENCAVPINASMKFENASQDSEVKNDLVKIVNPIEVKDTGFFSKIAGWFKGLFN